MQVPGRNPCDVDGRIGMGMRVPTIRPLMRQFLTICGVGSLIVACALPGSDPIPARGAPPAGSSSVILTVGPAPTATETQAEQTRKIGNTGPIPAASGVETKPLPAEAPPPPPPPPPPPAPTMAPGAQDAATAVAATAIAKATAVSATATALPAQLVKIVGYAFDPATLSIPTGTTVQFRNLDPTVHHIVSGEMDSGRLATNVAWASTFSAPGTTHSFVCRIHPTMKMVITVTDPQQRPTVVRPSS